MSTSSGKFRQSAIFVLVLLPGLLLLALPFLHPGETDYIFLLIGRFHPLVLHFPIVLIILALLLEVAGMFRFLPDTKKVITIVLITAAVSAFVAVVAGFLLYASGEYSGELVDQHFWAGVITGAGIFGTLAVFLIYKSTARFYWIYFFLLLFVNVSVGVTSHLGGSLTHGEDYLSEYLPMIMAKDQNTVVRSEEEMLVYDDMIVPVFEAKCYSCHNDRKSKGGLMMTAYPGLLKGGESGPSLTAGSLEESEIYHRVVLPADSADHMPPGGKTPMSASEIELLKFWIESGAKKEMRLTEARSDASFAPVVETLLPELDKYRRKQAIAELKFREAEVALAALAIKLDVIIYRDTLREDGLFAMAMKFPPAPFTNEQMREVKPYAEFFTSLSLVSSTIDDNSLYYIGQMSNVKSLFLQKTNINGSGLVYLQDMPNLELINLSYTKVDDKAAIDLLQFSNLREVYLFRSRASQQMVDALMKYKSGLTIHMEEGPYY